ncbi:MAG: hypothetical protein A2Y76_04360 [Planctomycetes bacterium RBG_13_60_9]|nr:MAG: hypothetical protein A2Y76_04360 [Planctomycetes bacterium RBG_13_60_9]
MKSQEELTQAVCERSKVVNGRRMLTCAEAFRLAAEAGVEPIRIGRVCNEQNIRLCSCQLGCFA